MFDSMVNSDQFAQLKENKLIVGAIAAVVVLAPLPLIWLYMQRRSQNAALQGEVVIPAADAADAVAADAAAATEAVAEVARAVLPPGVPPAWSVVLQSHNVQVGLWAAAAVLCIAALVVVSPLPWWARGYRLMLRLRRNVFTLVGRLPFRRVRAGGRDDKAEDDLLDEERLAELEESLGLSGGRQADDPVDVDLDDDGAPAPQSDLLDGPAANGQTAGDASAQQSAQQPAAAGQATQPASPQQVEQPAGQAQQAGPQTDGQPQGQQAHGAPQPGQQAPQPDGTEQPTAQQPGQEQQPGQQTGQPNQQPAAQGEQANGQTPQQPQAGRNQSVDGATPAPAPVVPNVLEEELAQKDDEDDVDLGDLSDVTDILSSAFNDDAGVDPMLESLSNSLELVDMEDLAQETLMVRSELGESGLVKG